MNNKAPYNFNGQPSVWARYIEFSKPFFTSWRLTVHCGNCGFSFTTTDFNYWIDSKTQNILGTVVFCPSCGIRNLVHKYLG